MGSTTTTNCLNTQLGSIPTKFDMTAELLGDKKETKKSEYMSYMGHSHEMETHHSLEDSTYNPNSKPMRHCKSDLKSVEGEGE